MDAPQSESQDVEAELALEIECPQCGTAFTVHECPADGDSAVGAVAEPDDQVGESAGDGSAAEPAAVARWTCPSCATELAAWVDRELAESEEDGGERHPIDHEPLSNAWIDEPWETPPLEPLAAVADAFAHPLRHGGVYVLVSGLVVGLVCAVVLPFATVGYAVFGVLGFALMGGYFARFVADIVTEAAAGRDTPISWPAPDPLSGDGFRELWRLFCAALAAALPTVVILWAVAPSVPAPIQLVLFLVAGLGWSSLFGIAYLAALLMGSLSAFRYFLLLRSVARTLGQYVPIILAVFFLLGVEFLLITVLNLPEFGRWHWIWWLIVGFAALFLMLYGVTVFARLIGLYYRNTRYRLDWFRSK